MTTLGELFDKDRENTNKDSGKAPHLVIRGLAGSAKTTTLCDGLRILQGVNPRIEDPSHQQEAVWDAMLLSHGEAGSICVTSFGRGIVDELATQVPAGVQAQTLHSMGYAAIRDSYVLKAGKSKKGSDNTVNRYKVDQILLDLLNVKPEARDFAGLPSTASRGLTLNKEQPGLLSAVKALTMAVKHNLIPLDIEPGPTEADDRVACNRLLQDLVDYYDLDVVCPTKNWEDVFRLVPQVLELCKDLKRYPYIDYDDMVWLPVVLGLRMFKYDLLVVDEAQDLNRCQQALAKMIGHRLVVCGDPQQSIYAFAGADCESMPRLYEELGKTKRGCWPLNLTTSFRCSQAVAEEARKVVPDFTAHPDNQPGMAGVINCFGGGPGGDDPVLFDDFVASLQNGDMVVCRVNLLLMQLWRPLRQRALNEGFHRVNPTILGKYNQILVNLAQRFAGAESMAAFRTSLEAYHEEEAAKERAKQKPSLQRLMDLRDRVECLTMLARHCTSVKALMGQVTVMFSSDAPADGTVRLATIHKAKGLEATRVFFLQPPGAGCPHPNATTEWQQAQERNLWYVAVTRAKESIIHVY